MWPRGLISGNNITLAADADASLNFNVDIDTLASNARADIGIGGIISATGKLKLMPQLAITPR